MTATLSRMDRLTEEFNTHLKDARGIAAEAEAAGGEFTDDQRSRLNESMGKAKDAKTALDAAKADQKTLEAVRGLGDLGELGGGKRTDSGLHVPDDGQSIGEFFVGSYGYKDVMAQSPSGHFTKDQRVEGRPVGFQRLIPQRGQKTLVTGLSDTSGGALVRNDWLGLQVGLGPFQRPLRLRELCSSGRTASDTVEYARVTGTTNAAAPVAEATATTGSSGDKPESGLATAKVTTPVRTIAHWVPITKRAMSDASQMLTLIDQFLLYGLEEVIDAQIITGDGTGENFDGIGHLSGVQTQAASDDADFRNAMLYTLRQAKTKVRLIGRAVPGAYLMNPADVEVLDLFADGNERYYFGGPGGSFVTQGGSAGPLWNLPIVESEVVPAGTAYVGDWSKAMIWDREQASITMSDSHLGFFTRNMVAILAECRLAFGVLQPSAFVEITLPVVTP